MLIVLDVRDLVVFGHGERVVDDFEVCLAVGVDVDELLSSEVVVLALSADRSLDLPRLCCWVLDCHLLGHFSPHHAVELQLLDGLLRLRDALADQVNVKRISALDGALDLEPDVVVRHVGMEGNSEVEILV